MSAKEKLKKCFESFKQKINFTPKIALVLGTGLGALADEIEVKHTLAYDEVDGFPISTVEGHKGRFVFGCLKDIPIVIMQGRVHYYEGYTMQDVVMPIRLMRLMGAETLFLTNASGSVNIEFIPGDFMLIRDQITNFVPSPLIGENFNDFGPRFPDMTEIYDKELREIIKNTAEKLYIKLREGVYIQLTGPNYESPAEVKMCRLLGADTVGMSTGCEAIAARHAGFKVCGISCVSNLGCGISDKPLAHEEVMESMNASAPKFKELIKNSIVNICKEK
ncbi:MAG: purine-nucleoside phosphorylase [Eubacterium sp.]|jgi:purine-nucleoside phosphorylase|nr:purine-nucleoside phosphorylase [Eubacterium sp.]